MPGAEAEYSFVISDSSGDGICCGKGQGKYEVFYNGVIFVNGGDFESSEETTFGNCPPPPQVVAEWNDLLKVPMCSLVGSSCTSGDLLDGKASNIEPNEPNTLDSCADGAIGSYHSDESIDMITVSAVGGGNLQAGGLAEIEAKVWPWGSGSYDTADFYFTADDVSIVSGPISWTFIGSLPANGSGLRTLKLEYYLPNSPTQAVRVSFRYGGSTTPCATGSFDDVDDLVFTVASSFDGTKHTRLPKSVPPLMPLQSTHCVMIGDEDRCDAVSNVCTWRNGDRGQRCYPVN